ncbi:MAG: Spi family protease inhibitor, partial [Desulfosarcinaceae bacterium]
MFLSAVTAGLADPVALQTAQNVARNKINQHLALYGQWNGSGEPSLGPGRAVSLQSETVAYLFPVNPSGYVLVTPDDAFSPVPLYSDRSEFDPQQVDNPNSLEAWILPRLDARLNRLKEMRRNPANGTITRFQARDITQRIQNAWSKFKDPAAVFTSSETDRSAVLLSGEVAPVRSAGAVGPLLTTIW